MKKIVLVMLAACGSSPSAPDTPDAGPIDDRASIGGIEIVEDRWVSAEGENPYSHVLGQIFDGGPAQFHHEVASDGDCTLRAYSPSECNPVCDTGLCVAPGVCEEWPTAISAGRLTVTGLAQPLTIDPQGGYYYNQDVLPVDLFADDADVEASFAGADLPAMTLSAQGVPPIAPQISNGSITLVPGDDFTLRWTPEGAGRVRVTLNANNQGHGLPYLAIITCDVPDSDGEVVIPASLHDQFPETYAWTACAGTDCPPSTIRRYTRGVAPVGEDQVVELTVASQWSFGVEHHP